MTDNNIVLTIVLACFASVVVIVCIVCASIVVNDTYAKAEQPQQQLQQPQPTSLAAAKFSLEEQRCTATPYGNDLYYFDCSGIAFGTRLSRWITEHPNATVSIITPDGTGLYGSTIGYFVVAKGVDV